MKISRRLLPAAVLVLLTTAVAACDGLPILGSDDTFQAIGTVEFREVEGGCWTLQTDRDQYDPIDLAEDFKKDGLRVRFEAEVRDDLTGFCPGEIVELRFIERT